jgi:hypothetical protein
MIKPPFSGRPQGGVNGVIGGNPRAPASLVKIRSEIKSRLATAWRAGRNVLFAEKPGPLGSR